MDKQVESSVVKTARGAGITFLTRILGKSFLLILQVLIARLYGAEAFGLFAIAWVIVRILWTISMFGLQNGLIKFGTELLNCQDEEGFKEVVHTSIFTNIMLGGVLGLLMYLSAPYLVSCIYEDDALLPFFQYFSILVLLLPLITVVASLSRISLNMRIAAIAEDVIAPVSIVCLLLLFYSIGVGTAAIIYANIIGYSLAVIYIGYQILKLFPILATKVSINFGRTKELYYYSVQTFSANLSAVLMTSLSRLILGGYETVKRVGFFQAASQIVIMLDIIGNTLRVISTPHFASLKAKGDYEESRKLYITITRWMLFTSAPIFAAILIDGDILLALFGEGFKEYTYILTILFIGQFINIATGPAVQILIIHDQQKRWMVISLSMLLVNFLLSILLISKYGILGGAIGVSVVNAATSLLSFYAISFVFEVNRITVEILKNITLVLIPILLVYIVGLYLPEINVFLGVGLNSILYIILFALGVYISGISEEDKELMASIKQKIIK
jgi:O-antigen/teichoic acid export membrane protein